MADQPKKKAASAVKRNDERKNGKAYKQKPEDYRGRKVWRGNKTTGTRVGGIEKVLLGGGALRNVARQHEGSVGGSWKFGGMPNGPFDSKQAAENRRLYPHLFTDK